MSNDYSETVAIILMKNYLSVPEEWIYDCNVILNNG